MRINYLGIAAMVLGQFLCAALCYAQELKITSPADGTVVLAGQTVTVSVLADAALGSLTLSTSDNLVTVSADPNSGNFSLAIPSNMPPNILSVIATAQTGITSNITLYVETIDNLISTQIIPPQIRFDGIGQQYTLRVVGSFADGNQIDLTPFTVLTLTTGNRSVASVTAGGVVTALGAGETEITTTFAGLSSSAIAQVTLSSGTTAPNISNSQNAPAPGMSQNTPEFSAANPETSGTNDASANSTNEQLKKICSLSGAANGLEACPNPIWIGNSFDTNDLNSGTNYTIYFDTQIWGARLDPGASAIPIHAFDNCYYLSNSSDQSIFVPFRTEMEWTSFLKNHPAHVILTPCTLHAIYTSTAVTSKGDHAVYSLPAYSRAGEIETLSQTFGYFEPEHCNQSNECSASQEWHETITVDFQAGASKWKPLRESVAVTQ